MVKEIKYNVLFYPNGTKKIVSSEKKIPLEKIDFYIKDQTKEMAEAYRDNIHQGKCKCKC